MAGLLRGARALGGLVQRLHGADLHASVRVGFSAGVPAASSRVAAAMASFAPAGGIVPSRWLSVSAAAPSSTEYVALNTIRDNEGAKKQRRRWARGTGSGRGKTAGRGANGQKSRSGGPVKLGFEGGQTPLFRKVPKRGFFNPFSRELNAVSIGKVVDWVLAGRLDASRAITLKDLRDSGAVSRKLRDGVKVTGAEAWKLRRLKAPLHLQVQAATAGAREAVEAAGGSVETVYYNALGLRALADPAWFAARGRPLPKPARIPPNKVERFDRRGDLPPNVDISAQTADA